MEIGTAPLDFAAVIAVGPLEPKHRDVTVLRGTIFHGNDRGHLLAGVLDHLVDTGGVVGDGFEFRLQPLRALQFRRRSDVGFKGEGEFLAGLKAFQQPIEATAQIGLADRLQGFLLNGVPPGAIN